MGRWTTNSEIQETNNLYSFTDFNDNYKKIFSPTTDNNDINTNTHKNWTKNNINNPIDNPIDDKKTNTEQTNATQTNNNKINNNKTNDNKINIKSKHTNKDFCYHIIIDEQNNKYLSMRRKLIPILKNINDYYAKKLIPEK